MESALTQFAKYRHLRDRIARACGTLVAVGAAVTVATCCWPAGRNSHLVKVGAILGHENAPLPSPTGLNDLLRSGTNQINVCDIARMNLLCAERLPGAEGPDCNSCLATLDEWAGRIRSETERHFYRYKAKPTEFDNSEGYFRMLMMAVVLYEDFTIRYNPDQISVPATAGAEERFFADSRDIFLHGLCSNRRMGTCSSLPVLYVALGRRLGYPLKLATTKSHLFLRWESPSERFDLEATGKGMNRYDDEHFKRWPFPVSEEEIRADGYLKSLTPTEELALFLSLRGNCLKEAGRIQEAVCSHRAAADLVPGCRAYRVLLADTVGGSSRLFPAESSRQLPAFGSGLPPNVVNSATRSGLQAERHPLPKTQ